MACDHTASATRIKILKRQKIALAQIVNYIEEKRLTEIALAHHRHLSTASYSGEATDALSSLTPSVFFINTVLPRYEFCFLKGNFHCKYNF